MAERPHTVNPYLPNAAATIGAGLLAAVGASTMDGVGAIPGTRIPSAWQHHFEAA